jgi:hypothetical protein
VTHTMTAPRMRFWVDIVRFCTTSNFEFLLPRKLIENHQPQQQGQM